MKWHREDKAALFKSDPKLAACERSDKTKLQLDTDVVTYEMCSGVVRDQFGIKLDESTLDELPETAQ